MSDCFCGRQWPHPNDDPGPPVCPVCGREWDKTRGSEGSAFTLRCEHDDDETCWHPGEVCEYWYSPWAHMTCGFGRGKRQSRKEAEHEFIPFKSVDDWCDKCSRPARARIHVAAVLS